MDLVDEKNQLNLLVESKNTVIAKLQKQLYEVCIERKLLLFLWIFDNNRLFVD